MERIDDLALVLKSFRYAERDVVAVLLTEHHGKVTAMAKGAVHSRRYGGSLQFLAASNVRYVRKPHAEMARLEEAASRHEFKNITGDMTRFSVAAFMAEFCMKLVEPDHPVRELFVILSNALKQLDEGQAPLLVMNAFLVKALRALGYAPNLTHCSACTTAADILASERPEGAFFFDDVAGGLLCERCREASAAGRSSRELPVEMILLFCDLVVRGFRDLANAAPVGGTHLDLYRLLSAFMHQHIPAIHAGGGLKSMQVLDDNELLSGPSAL